MGLVGLVGYGRWGKNLARNLSKLGVLHTICDTQPITCLSLYRDVHLTSDYCSMLADRSLCHIVIATPPDTHFALAKQALMAGKDVFVEKPLCLDVSSARELVEIAQQRKLILMVGHLLHYHPCMHYIKEVVAEGEIGQVRYVAAHRFGASYLRKESVLWDLVPHDLSVILSLFPNKLISASEAIGSAIVSESSLDTMMVHLNFDQQINAHIYVSWVYPFKEHKLTVIGTKGALVFDDTKPWKEKLALYQRAQLVEGKIDYANPRYLHVPEEEPLFQECLHFINCCEQRNSPITDGVEALRLMQILEQLQEHVLLEPLMEESLR